MFLKVQDISRIQLDNSRIHQKMIGYNWRSAGYILIAENGLIQPDTADSGQIQLDSSQIKPDSSRIKPDTAEHGRIYQHLNSHHFSIVFILFSTGITFFISVG